MLIWKKIFLYIFLIIFGFFIGKNFDSIKENFLNIFFQKKACTLEVKVCPDGTAVGRIAPNCDFAPCPEVKKNENINQKICGGIANIACPEGYYCQIKEKYPDAAGNCIKKEDSSKGGKFDFVCPTSDYIDCMPGPGPKKTECNPAYLKWVQENCPNFKGVAY